jgi:hypothetical protein
MKKALVAVALWAAAMAGPVAAANARTDDRRAVCPTREASETDVAYSDRAQSYCEVRWTGLVAARQTGGRTHDEFINACAKRCAPKYGSKGGANLALIGLGLAAAGGAAGAAGGGSRPASP